MVYAVPLEAGLADWISPLYSGLSRSAQPVGASARELEAAARRYAAELNVTIKRVSVRDQSSRWGSCSSSGSLNFSWRLIMAPSFVLDYLAAHEIAHRKEMNHSARFWRVCSISA